MMKLIYVIALCSFTFLHVSTALAEDNKDLCKGDYSYFIDDDDQADIITSKIGSYIGDTARCSYTLELSKSGRSQYFYLNTTGGLFSAHLGVFDSSGLLKDHKKDQVSIYYKMKGYEEVHHFKLFKKKLFIDSLDLIYPDKTVHKTIEGIKWGVEMGKFLVNMKESDNQFHQRILDFYKLSNQQRLSIIEEGGGSTLLWYLQKNYKGKKHPYFSFYLSKTFEQFGLKTKSKTYYLNYLSILANNNITPDPAMTGNDQPINIQSKFTEIPKNAGINTITSGDINKDGTQETAVLSYIKKKGYVLQIYQKQGDHYKLLFTSPPLKSYENELHNGFKYYIETDEEQDLDLSINDGFLHFTIQARGPAYTDHRYITPYFHIKNKQLILRYSENIWQKDGERQRSRFTIDYEKKYIAYGDYQNTPIDDLSKNLEGIHHRFFTLNKPITLKEFSFYSPVKNIFETSYSHYAKDNFDYKFKLAKDFYKKKHFYKILSLYSQKSINLHLKEYPLSSDNIQQYNDIAYFLQKANAHITAIKLLEKVINYDPERIVAYLNIADSYVAVKHAYKSQRYYFEYIRKMKRAGKQRKIPQHVKEDFPIVYSLTNNKNISKLMGVASGDLNGDKKDDIAVALKMMPLGEKAFSLLVTADKGAKKEATGALTIENIQYEEGGDVDELTYLAIIDSELIFHFSTDYGKEVYKFKKLDDSYQLIWRESNYLQTTMQLSQTTTVDFINKAKTIETSFRDYALETGNNLKNEIKKETNIREKGISLKALYNYRRKLLESYENPEDDNY